MLKYREERKGLDVREGCGGKRREDRKAGKVREDRLRGGKERKNIRMED